MMKSVVYFDANNIVATVQRERIKRELVQIESNVQRLKVRQVIRKLESNTLRPKVGQVNYNSIFSSQIFICRPHHKSFFTSKN